MSEHGHPAPGVSLYELRIGRPDGKTVRLRPGSQAERDFVQAIVDRAVSKGVGIFRTEAKVRVAITAAIDEVIYEAKAEVVPE